MSKQEQLREALIDAALAAALELKEFLGTYRGKDPDRFKRAQIAGVTVGGVTRFFASENNRSGMMMLAARRTGVSAQDTLELAKGVGLLPPAVMIEQPKQTQ